MSLLFLGLSIILSSVRNILSKGISDVKFGTKQFFLTQACIFICGSLVLILVANQNFERPTLPTLFYATLYGILLLSAQYCYTSALKKGNIGICSTVYSLGFIFPTLSGNMFWNERLTSLNIIGILMVIPTIIISGMSSSKNRQHKNKNINTYIVPLMFAMLSSGGLGIMQKVQQNSHYPEQKNLFVISAFALAGTISFLISLFAKREPQIKIGRKLIFGIGIGVAFGLCNLLNTILAGQLDSAVFFPVLNIGTIFFSIVSGIIFYKEKISKNDLIIFLLGIISILFITNA
ncbi:MAG: hypothetical protein E7583_05660 [Ruminococcaceae bacterium]|nr:hypothetical protein [Oscillospiraceae bacterium]